MNTVPSSRPEIPPLYCAAEIAAALRCSEWWVKDQARKGVIPFTKAGGAYRFTADHFDEIVRIFENRPVRGTPPLDGRQSAGRRPSAPRSKPVKQLKARVPRRAQAA